MKIEILYPEIGNLYGELANVRYLAACVPGAEVVRTSLRSEPAFLRGGVDLVYMGSMTERSQAIAVEALRPYKEKIEERIEAGQAFLITGNAMEIFGQYIENEDGTRIHCLGIFGCYAKRTMMDRFNGLYYGRMGELEIVGFKSQFSHTYGEPGAEPLIKTVRGYGMHSEGAPEGIRKNNFMATYLLGPLLVLNPPLLKYLIKLLGESVDELLYEEAAMVSYRQRLKEFKDPKTGFSY